MYSHVVQDTRKRTGMDMEEISSSGQAFDCRREFDILEGCIVQEKIVCYFQLGFCRGMDC